MRKCSNCGAPIGATAVVCEFCQAENPLQPVAPPPLIVAPFRPVPQAPPPASAAGAVIGLAVAGAVVIAIAVSVIAWAGSAPPPPPRVTITTPAVTVPQITIPPGINVGPKSRERTPVEQLHTKRLDWMNTVPLSAPGMVGTLDKFDVLANWDWAVGIGKAWWSDAELYTFHVNPVGKDGLTDLTQKDASVDYHLVSKLCRADQKKRAETEKVDETSCCLEITVDKDGPSVQLDLIAVDNTGRSKPIPRPTCSIAGAFDQIGARLTKRPTYSIRLQWDVFGYRYTISEGRDSASMDNTDVNPNACKKK